MYALLPVLLRQILRVDRRNLRRLEVVALKRDRRGGPVRQGQLRVASLDVIRRQIDERHAQQLDGRIVAKLQRFS